MTTEIDGYTDLEIIGRGGFAVVYKARQVSVGRDVAIKLLTDPAPDADLVRRFQRESQAVGALSWHPHIAAVVDAGSTTLGQAYIVFELLSGGSLEERLAPGPLSWTDAVSAMIQVADAVEAAHRSDVLHRDIKPANILLDRIGVAKLGDFGIASMQDGSKTETGMLATTVAHAAPELFDGKPASPATDIYALGSTLHTLVAGEPPFTPNEGERIGAVISRIASEPPPRPDRSLVPEPIATVIAHALAKQPQYRPRSAAAFGQALQRAQRSLGQRVTTMPFSDNTPAATPVPTRSPAAVAPAPPAGDPKAGASSADDQLPQPLAATAAPATVPASSAVASDSVRLGDSPPAAAPPRPFSKTIAALSVLAVLLAAGVGGLLFYQTQRGPTAALTTAGGAAVLSFDALDATELPAPMDEGKALDGDSTTSWGIMRAADGTGIIGTSYVIKLTEEHRIVRVGISYGDSGDLGRASGVIWGTSIDELEAGGSSVISPATSGRTG